MAANSTVLVTGCAGFIGRRVCSRLAAEVVRTVCLDRKGDAGVTECDITDSGRLERVFQSGRFDAVIHLASLLHTASRDNPLLATDVNIIGSTVLLEMSRRFGVRRVVYGSSIAVYGSTAPEPARETGPASPEDTYGAAKRYVELLGEGLPGIEFRSLRIATVVGGGPGAASSRWRTDLFDALSAPEAVELSIPYGPEEKAPLVCVEDVANMLVMLAEAPRVSHSIYNTPSETWSFADLKREVERLNPNVRVRLGSAAVTGIPRVIDGARFASEFDYRPVPLIERLRRL